MDNLIKELAKEIKKQKDKVEKKNEKTNKECEIVFKSNRKRGVEVIGVSGQEVGLLSAICVILRNMEQHSSNSAECMAMLILTSLKMEKELND